MRQLGSNKVNVYKTIKLRNNFGQFQLLLMCIPALVIIFLINYLPMFGLFTAFQDFRIGKGVLSSFFGSQWIGFKNFEFLFMQDAWRITRNTIGMNLIFIFVGLAFSVTLALMLNEITKRFLIKAYQTIMFFPYFLSWVVVGYALYAFLSMDHGILNNFLKHFISEPIQWYTNPKYWPFILTISYLWKWGGYFTLIYYAAIMSFDNEMYEAAAIDGANRLQMAWRISVPLLQPIMIVMVLLQVGRIFYSDFGMFFNLPMQSGSLFETTDVIDTYVYRTFRYTGQVGLSVAAGLYQALVGFTLVMISNYIVKKINPENALY